MKTTMGLKEKEDYQEAFDGKQALDAVKSFGNDNPFVVILMDLTMPTMDGFESSKQIMDYCKQKKMKIMPIIYAVTASTKTDELESKC